jgi:hypothetical protein
MPRLPNVKNRAARTGHFMRPGLRNVWLFLLKPPYILGFVKFSRPGDKHQRRGSNVL